MARKPRGLARKARIEAAPRTFTPNVSAFQRKWLTSLGALDAAFEEGGSRWSGSGDPSVVKSDRWRMMPARRDRQPSGISANSSIQLALTRASGLSGLEGRQDTDQ